MGVSVEAIAARVQGTLWGESDRMIEDTQSIEKAGPQDITFLSERSRIRSLKKSRAGAVIVGRDFEHLKDSDRMPPSIIVVDDAQVAFIQILQEFRPPRPRPNIGVSDRAQVGANVTIGQNTNVFPGAFIADNVTIGDECDIYPGVYIGQDCRMGDNTTVYPNAVLYPDVRLGNRVIIHACAVLGADGFGYRFADGQFHKIPQLGSVLVEDDVEIGAGTTVDRGMIGPTVVGQGTKLDNQIMIGHNCELGRHNAFASQVGLAGSVTTGDYVRCAGHVGIADHVHIGEGVTLLAKAGVHRDLAAGQAYVGTPARPKEEALSMVMALPKVPEMRRTLESLVAEVEDLRSQIAALSSAETATEECRNG